MERIDKPIRMSGHALQQAQYRGTNEVDVINAIRSSEWKQAEQDRLECRMNIPYNKEWNGTVYSTQQIRPIFVDDEKKITVVTVYTYYF